MEVFDVHVLFKELPSGIKYPRTSLKKGILTIKNVHEKVGWEKEERLLYKTLCCKLDGTGI